MRYRKADDVIERTIGEAFLVVKKGRKDGKYGFDGLGRDVWHAVTLGHSAEDIVKDVINRYGVGEEEARKDVKSFLGDLCEQELIIPVD